MSWQPWIGKFSGEIGIFSQYCKVLRCCILCGIPVIDNSFKLYCMYFILAANKKISTVCVDIIRNYGHCNGVDFKSGKWNVESIHEGLPGVSMRRSPPANAGDMDCGTISHPQSSWAHVPQLLSLFSRALEPQLVSLCVAAAWGWCALEPMPCNKGSHHNKSSHRNYRVAPHLLPLEKSLHSGEDPAQPKIS